MTPPRWLGWLVAGLAVAVALGGLWLVWLTRGTVPPAGTEDDVSATFFVGWLVFVGVGVLLAVKRPGNSVGWLLLAAALSWELNGLAGVYRVAALAERPDWPGAAWAAWAWDWTWAPALLAVFLLPYVFPNGRLLSRRWRKAVGLLVGGAFLLAASVALRPGPMPNTPLLSNPAGLEALAGIYGAMEALGAAAMTIGGIGGFVSAILRYRRSGAVERHQLKWFAYAGMAVVAAFVLADVLEAAGMGPSVVGNIRVIPLLLLPIAIAIAVLGYRLYDIDLVINRTIVYGALAAFIGMMYLTVVVGAGSLISARQQTDIPLSILATAVTAVAFAPARERLQRLANRLVYGKRSSPYEALASFTARPSDAADGALDEMARTVCDAVGAERAEVWVRSGTELRRAARWPAPLAEASVPAPDNRDGPVDLPEVDHTYPVRRGGRLLGALAVRTPRGERLRPTDDLLLTDLASAAWLLLANMELIGELRASRQRLVTAQDAERARIERDLHDGAQQRLLEVALTLQLAREQEGGGFVDVLAEAQVQLGAALAELREFARGIHPAILSTQGLGPALESLADRSPIPVAVDLDGIGRLLAPVEVTAYFVVSEALANVLKHAYATAATVTLRVVDGWLQLAVSDDGVGGADPTSSGLQGLADRVAALDGRLEVSSPPGGGTRVEVSLPCG